MKQGPDLDRFHATTDKQVNRNAVVRVLSTRENWRLAAVVIEKSKVYPEFGEPHHFYPQFAGSVLKYVFHRHVADGTDSILVLTDTLPVQRFRDAVEKAIKLRCRHEQPANIRFGSYHHPAASNCWIQVADYCSWAVFKKWKHADVRTYEQLRARLAEPELDALRAGMEHFY